MPFPREVRTATLVWRGLKAGRRLEEDRRLKRLRGDPLGMTRRPPVHVTSLKQKVRVRGKRR